MMKNLFLRQKRLTPFQTIVIGFASVILGGTFLLMLPVSAKLGETSGFLDALFTSVTSVCVTGLVVQDTGTYWSQIGQRKSQEKDWV